MYLVIVHLSTHVHLNFCASQALVHLNSYVCSLFGYTKGQQPQKRKMPPFEHDGNIAPILIDYVTVWCQIDLGITNLYFNKCLFLLLMDDKN